MFQMKTCAGQSFLDVKIMARNNCKVNANQNFNRFVDSITEGIFVWFTFYAIDFI